MYNNSGSTDKETLTQDKYFYKHLSENESTEIACSEYSSFGESDVQIKGRLKRHIAFWRKIEAYDNILDIIENGYKLPFLDIPPPACFNNNCSAVKNKDFVEAAILELLSSGRVEEVDCGSLQVVNPLSVSINSSGKKRLILDLRYINQYLVQQTHKLDDWKIMFQYVKKGSFLFSFDLAQAFHGVDICDHHQTFLGFSYVVEGVKKFFKFTVLPFGMKLSPFVYTKLFHPLIKYWRGQGIKIVVYLDDGAGCNENYEHCLRDSQTVRKDLLSAGFVINEEKSHFIPVQIRTWLGLIWNCELGILQIPPERFNKLESLTSDIYDCLFGVTARKLARLAGIIISLSPSIGNISRLMTRQLYRVINQRTNWDTHFSIAEDYLLLNELDFWQQNVRKLDGSRHFDDTDRNVSIKIQSDASSYAIAAVLELGNPQICHRMLTEAERMESSTHRELLAIIHALEAFAPLLSRQDISLCSDSSSAVSIIEKGSTKPNLQNLALRLENQIRLKIHWLPRAENMTADYLSKMNDTDDWGITNAFLQYLNTFGQELTFDRFANSSNAKLKLFNSKYWDIGSAGIDAFCQDWSGHYNLLVPPLSLVLRCLNYWTRTKAKGILVSPAWESAVYWPVFFPNSDKTPSSIRSCLILPNSGNIFVPGSNPYDAFGRNLIRKVLVVIFDGT